MRTVASFVTLIAVAIGISAPVGAQAPIKIGILTELSGPMGGPGSAVRDGFLLYLKKTESKLGGRSVTVIAEDTANDPGTAISKAKKLVEADKIDALIGPLNSAIGMAIKGYLVEQKMPSLLSATVDEISDGSYIFRTTFTANADSFLNGFLPGKAGYRKAVTIAANYVAGQVAANYFEKGFAAAGGTVVQKLLPRLGAPDYGPFLSQISPEADVAIVSMVGGDAVRFMKQFADSGSKLPIYGFPSTVDEALLPAQGKAAIGFVGSTFYYSTISSQANQAFLKEWSASSKEPPSWFAVGGYIAGQVLDAAISAQNGDISNRAAFVAALKAVRISAPSGDFKFDESNNPVQPRYIMQIREKNGVGRPEIFASIRDFRSAIEPPSLPSDIAFPK